MNEPDTEITEAEELYVVVVNHEEQYSVWSADEIPPAGWQTVGEARSRSECLAWIEEFWTDMRPLSVRRRMDHV